MMFPLLILTFGLLVSLAAAHLSKTDQFYADKFGWSQAVQDLVEQRAAPSLTSYSHYTQEQLDNFIVNGYKYLFASLDPTQHHQRYSSLTAQQKHTLYAGTGHYKDRIHWHWAPLIDRFEGSRPILHQTTWTKGDAVTDTPDVLRLDIMRTGSYGPHDNKYDLPRSIVRYRAMIGATQRDRFEDIHVFPTSSVAVQHQIARQQIPKKLLEIDVKRHMDRWLRLVGGDLSLQGNLEAYWRPFSIEHMIKAKVRGEPSISGHSSSLGETEAEMADFLANLKDLPTYFHP